MDSTKKSQNTKILEYLQSGRKITSLEALNLFGCSRLASRIDELKDAGNFIRSDMVPTPTGKRVAQYSIIKPVQFTERVKKYREAKTILSGYPDKVKECKKIRIYMEQLRDKMTPEEREMV